MHLQGHVVALMVCALALFSCAQPPSSTADWTAPDWTVGDTWTVTTRHQNPTSSTGSDWTSASWQLTVTGYGTVDGTPAWRIRATERWQPDRTALRLYYRAGDLQLVRIEQALGMRGERRELAVHDIHGTGPYIARNAHLPYALPVFGLADGVHEVTEIVNGGAARQTKVSQVTMTDEESLFARLSRSGTTVRIVWDRGQPWWSSAVLDDRVHAELTDVGHTEVAGRASFEIHATSDASREPPLEGRADFVPWSSSLDDGVAPGWSIPMPWSGYWWPWLDAPGNTTLYAANGPLARYDAFVTARWGFNPGTQTWEYQNHRTLQTVNSWWGHCNGVAAASVLEPEPVEPVNIDGVAFGASDVKGLLAEMYQASPLDLWQGTRHSGKRAASGVVVDDPSDPSYQDIRPIDLHVVLQDWLGNYQRPVVADIATGFEVWSYVAYAYQMQEVPDPTPGWKQFETTVWFAGSSPFTKTYRYRLALDASGAPSGQSEWMGSSIDDHPDFVWHPYGPGTQSPLWYPAVKEVAQLAQNQPVFNALSADFDADASHL